MVLTRARSAGGHRQRSLIAYALRLPRDLEAKDVSAFLTACTGIRARRWQRPFVVRAIGWRSWRPATALFITSSSPPAYADVVLAALRASIPGVVAGRDELYRAQQWA